MSEKLKADNSEVMTVVLDMSKRLGAMEQKMSAIPHDRHNMEHAWIKMDMERKQAQLEFWIDIRKRLATATIIGAFGLLISALGYAMVQWITSIKPGG